MTILDAIEDKHLFEPWFSRGTWENWRIFLSALFGLPLTSSQLAIFRECTGRSTPQTVAATEGWLICGRRSGKSFMLALVSVFLACFFDWQKYLAPGERGTIIIIAVNTRQARTIFRYVGALLKGVPMLARMIERETADSFDLNNSISVEVHTASFRSTRGYAVLAALLDEIAYFPTDDAAEPDREIINALKPGMAQFPNAMLLCASSPYAKRGSLFDAWRKHYGKDGDPILVWQAATRTMNPTIVGKSPELRQEFLHLPSAPA